MRTIQKARPERQLARDAGLPTYQTGRPCKHGHLAGRFTVDASCIGCRKAFKEGYRAEAAEYAQRWRDSNPEEARRRSRESSRRRRIRDPEAVRALERKHGKLKRERHPQRKLADTRKRQADKLLRTPAWAELDAIKAFYEACPEGMVVDHIDPLRGKLVSGLHVLANLQYLTPEANLRKGNSFEPYEVYP